MGGIRTAQRVLLRWRRNFMEQTPTEPRDSSMPGSRPIAHLFSYRPAALSATIAATLLVISTSPASAQQDPSNHQQQGIFLKDPTPREPDLEQKYAVNPSQVGTVDHASMTLVTERQKLIAHASKNLATLATTLHASLDKHAPGSYEPELEVAALMESLAKNINSALRAGTTDKHPPAAARAVDEPLASTPSVPAPVVTAEESLRLRVTSASARLVELTRQLQEDVTAGGTNTLSTSALSRSAEIEALAKNLKQDLKKTPRG